MELLNATGMVAGYTMGIDPSAREHVVVAVKGTFRIPADGGSATLAPPEEQVPLVMADRFTGEPGFSAPLYEADFPLRKPRCDVLLNATAWAPGGRPATRVRIGVKLGAWFKTFEVVGERIWQRSGVSAAPSRPAEFLQQPITYDVAFGGVDRLDPDPAHHAAYMANPIGRGWHQDRNVARLEGAPVPNTEAVGEPVSVPWGRHRPMGLGPLGRGWQPRLAWAGTYDQHWLDNVFPFLPPDFDDRYHQAAPEDQQIEHPVGGEEVTLVNLTPEGRTAFRLPQVEVPVVFFRKEGGREETAAKLDTILIEPNLERLMLTWRASLPLRR
ncbi:MAG TPA: DUF2169 domain-containing protein, partial [Geminicoccaceae bacterium]|nr:DUF2169 domain-containing protein [Geminicoccaceae bacterium]